MLNRLRTTRQMTSKSGLNGKKKRVSDNTLELDCFPVKHVTLDPKVIKTPRLSIRISESKENRKGRKDHLNAKPNSNGNRKNKHENFQQKCDRIVQEMVKEIDREGKLYKMVRDFPFVDGEFEKIAKYCFKNDNFIDFIKKNFPQDLVDVKTIGANKMKHVIKFVAKQWEHLITKFIEHNCLCSSIDDLKVIVIGTVGTEGFASTAMVADSMITKNFEIPTSVEMFKKAYDQAFAKKVNKFDYTARRAKEHGYLFINTCLSEHFEDLINSVYTTEWINRLIKCCYDQPLTILDMRLTSFMNRQEVDVNNVEQDIEFYTCSYQGDTCRLNLNPKVHKRIRLGSPVRWDNSNDADDEEKEENGKVNDEETENGERIMSKEMQTVVDRLKEFIHKRDNFYIYQV